KRLREASSSFSIFARSGQPAWAYTGAAPTANSQAHSSSAASHPHARRTGDRARREARRQGEQIIRRVDHTAELSALTDCKQNTVQPICKTTLLCSHRGGSGQVPAGAPLESSMKRLYIYFF